MQQITTEKLPIYIWTDEIEESALRQAKNLANHPFAFHHIAIMPDVHSGYGMPIGGVLATKDIVIPNAVGVDIGCGMCAVKSDVQIKEISVEVMKMILGKIRTTIPVGFNHHKESQDESLMPKMDSSKLTIVNQEYKSALKQIGTLGGGNHFIDIQKDNNGYLWVMLHSGSRNIGLKVAEYYNKLAISLRDEFKSTIPLEWELDYLPVDSRAGELYIKEMNYCVDFALANRKLMMNMIMGIIYEVLTEEKIVKDINWDEIINIAHNYADLEEHFGEKVWLHRKGATKAYKDGIGIIPGSQGTPSYIVKGKGSVESFKSCSHGAGRKMSRHKAIKELDMQEEMKNMEKKGILHGIRGKQSLDEAPGAYKDIEKVMENQNDLVEIIEKIDPVAIVKV